MAELAARYLKEHVAVRCKRKTPQTARGVIDKHILPAFGKLPLAAVGREEVTGLHYRLCETSAMANMVVYTLSHMFNMAIAWGMAPEGSNPCRLVVKYRERKCERFLTEEEFNRLWRVLGEAETKGGVSAHAVAAIRLLMLTECPSASKR